MNMKNEKSNKNLGSVANGKILEYLLNNQDFLQECELAQEKFAHTPEPEIAKENEETGELELVNEGLRDMVFMEEPRRIVKLFNLDSAWEQPIREFIGTGELKVPATSGLEVKLVFNRTLQRYELFLQIFKNTKQQDVLDNRIWDFIREAQKKLLAQAQATKYTKLEARLVGLRKKGKTFNEIADILLEEKLVKDTIDEKQLSEKYADLIRNLKLST